VVLETTYPAPSSAPYTLRNAEPLYRPTDSERSQALQQAVSGLARNAPAFSADTLIWWRQAAWAAIAAAALAALAVVQPATASGVMLTVLAIPFACIAIFRTAAILMLMVRRPGADRRSTRLPEHTLPTYSILVPLRDEANMVPQIVAALTIIDYPGDKLEVSIILEADDHRTRAAFENLPLPRHFKVVIVPTAHPRTKPKALNYALCFANGDYVVVYDAEDLPAPGQLKDAASVFRAAPANLACLQARLLIHNTGDSWLTRQFSLEYLALFDGLLPAYQAFGVPLPLGGTSNHFPRRVLDELGGWDPCNVTEDADLGIRLARMGYEARMLASDTWEEAPADFDSWFPQRTRWLKGWMQTWLVHTRQPLRLFRELGPVGFAGFHMIFGGMILAALVHPVIYGLLIWQFATIGPFATAASGLEQVFTGVTAFNLVLGYLSAIFLGIVVATRRGQAGLLLHVVTIPIYWLLISAAAWRAVWQLFSAPTKWEKTRHRIKL